MFRWKIGLVVLGTAGWFAFGGRMHAAAFCAGAVASAGSFWFLSQMVKAIGGEKVSPLRSTTGALRLAIIGYLLFVIMENYRLPLPALVTGLLVAIAAISIEVIRQHFYA